MDQSLWELLHPLAALLPMGLLLAAMIVVLSGLIWPAHRRAFGAAGLCILAVGAISTAVATETGRFSAHQLQHNPHQPQVPKAEQLLEQHTHQATVAAAMYYFSACLAAAIFLSSLFHKRLAEGRLSTVGNLLLLSILAAAGYLLAHSAESGIRLSRQRWPFAGRADPWAQAAEELAPPLDQRQ